MPRQAVFGSNRWVGQKSQLLTSNFFFWNKRYRETITRWMYLNEYKWTQLWASYCVVKQNTWIHATWLAGKMVGSSAKPEKNWIRLSNFVSPVMILAPFIYYFKFCVQSLVALIVTQNCLSCIGYSCTNYTHGWLAFFCKCWLIWCRWLDYYSDT